MIAELQEVLHKNEVEAVQACEELSTLKQQLAAEKERARMSWKSNCEHLAEQNAIITVQKEELAMLKHQIVELQLCA